MKDIPLRKFEHVDQLLVNYKYQESFALRMAEAKLECWTPDEVALHRTEREQTLLDAIAILQSENTILRRHLKLNKVVRAGRRAQIKHLHNEVQRLRVDLTEWTSRFFDKDKAHRKISAVVRMFWSPDEWREKRNECALVHPNLFDSE